MIYTGVTMRPSRAPAGVDAEGPLCALLERHRAGDRTALNGFAVEIYPYVHRFVYRLIGAGRDQLHDDLVQSSLEQICRALDGFQGRARVTTFVFGICYRVIAKHRRAEHIRSFFRRSAEDACTPSPPADLDDLLDRERQLAQARQAVDGLDSAERAAFVLHELENLPLEEVAAALGCSTRTIKRRLRSARVKLTGVGA